jgi:hypothetical protein
MYRDIVGRIIIDRADAALQTSIDELGVAVSVTGTVMRTDEDKVRLAAYTLTQFKKKASGARA